MNNITIHMASLAIALHPKEEPVEKMTQAKARTEQRYRMERGE
jgi:hypothetical protein